MAFCYTKQYDCQTLEKKLDYVQKYVGSETTCAVAR